MSPLLKPEWQTDIKPGAIDDLFVVHCQRIENMILREIPRLDSSQPFSLRWPLKVVIELTDDLVTAANEELDLLAYGSTKDECMQNFFSLFADMRQHYTEIADDEIMGQAVRLKALFSSITERV